MTRTARALAHLSDEALVLAAFCALQEGDYDGHLPGAVIQTARGRGISSSLFGAQVSFWCSVNAKRGK